MKIFLTIFLISVSCLASEKNTACIIEKIYKISSENPKISDLRTIFRESIGTLREYQSSCDKDNEDSFGKIDTIIYHNWISKINFRTEPLDITKELPNNEATLCALYGLTRVITHSESMELKAAATGNFELFYAEFNSISDYLMMLQSLGGEDNLEYTCRNKVDHSLIIATIERILFNKNFDVKVTKSKEDTVFNFKVKINSPDFIQCFSSLKDTYSEKERFCTELWLSNDIQKSKIDREGMDYSLLIKALETASIEAIIKLKKLNRVKGNEYKKNYQYILNIEDTSLRIDSNTIFLLKIKHEIALEEKRIQNSQEDIFREKYTNIYENKNSSNHESILDLISINGGAENLRRNIENEMIETNAAFVELSYGYNKSIEKKCHDEECYDYESKVHYEKKFLARVNTEGEIILRVVLGTVESDQIFLISENVESSFEWTLSSLDLIKNKEYHGFNLELLNSTYRRKLFNFSDNTALYGIAKGKVNFDLKNYNNKDQLSSGLLNTEIGLGYVYKTKKGVFVIEAVYESEMPIGTASSYRNLDNEDVDAIFRTKTSLSGMKLKASYTHHFNNKHLIEFGYEADLTSGTIWENGYKHVFEEDEYNRSTNRLNVEYKF